MIQNTFALAKPMARIAGKLAGLASCALLSASALAANCTSMPVSGKSYYIVNEGSRLNLDVSGAAKTDGATVIQWPSNSKANQQWTVTDLGNGSWSIRPVHSNKALDVLNWSREDLGAVKQWTYTGYANQQWKLGTTESGAFQISSTFSSLLVTVANSSQATAINQRPDQSSAYQRWFFNPVDGNCPAFGTAFMGSNKVLIGGSMNNKEANAAPFDARYAYVHSKPAASSSYYTDKLCSQTATDSGWWGCWGGTTTAPGSHVTWWNDYVAKETWQGKPRPQMFFWTWYSLRDLGDMAGQGDGPGEVVAINDVKLLTMYLNDYRFFLQKIGSTRAMIDIEPDFWGYVKSLGNPHNVSAKVRAANPSECGQEEDSAAGLAHCLITMARIHAKNVGVGMHATCFDYHTDPEGCVSFLKDMTKDADFMVADIADRDAAWYAKQGKNWYWWNGTKGEEALAFYKKIAEGTGKPLVLWQIPVGNMAQNNTKNHYQDDKVDYLFSHMNDVAGAHIVGLLFGPGEGEQTCVDTDGGNLIRKTIEYRNAGGQLIR